MRLPVARRRGGGADQRLRVPAATQSSGERAGAGVADGGAGRVGAAWDPEPKLQWRPNARVGPCVFSNGHVLNGNVRTSVISVIFSWPEKSERLPGSLEKVCPPQTFLTPNLESAASKNRKSKSNFQKLTSKK